MTRAQQLTNKQQFGPTLEFVSFFYSVFKITQNHHLGCLFCHSLWNKQGSSIFNTFFVCVNLRIGNYHNDMVFQLTASKHTAMDLVRLNKIHSMAMSFNFICFISSRRCCKYSHKLCWNGLSQMTKKWRLKLNHSSIVSNLFYFPHFYYTTVDYIWPCFSSHFHQ